MAQHCTPSYSVVITGNTATFQDQSSADGTITGYNWTFGDGQSSTEQNPSYTYAQTGVYEVCLTIFAHNPDCHATFCHHITIEALADTCHAGYSVHQPDPHLLSFDFTDLSQGSSSIISWNWDFEDGQTFSEQNPSHTYDHSGTYLVCLFIATADSSCVDHYCHHVVIHRTILDDHNDDFAQRMASNDDASFQVSGNPSDPETEQGEPLRPKAVVLEDNDSDLSIHLSPNPFSEFIVLEFNLEQDAMVNVTIVDLAGKSVFKNETQFLAKGLFQNQINVGHLSDGVYIFRVEFNGETMIRKVVKTK